MISYLAARGQLEKLKELGEKDPEVFHLEDENGWQVSLHAIRLLLHFNFGSDLIRICINSPSTRLFAVVIWSS